MSHLPTSALGELTRTFYKVEGLGNDFVLLDHRHGGATPTPSEVRWLCDRHRGIGADGVLEVLQTEAGTPWMRLHNADGGLALMCGNGLRCVARFVALDGHQEAGVPFSIHTDSGPRTATLRADGQIAVAMGAAADGGLVRWPAGNLEGRKVDMGNPHWVHVARTGPVGLDAVGPSMQAHPAFPDGVNVSVVEAIGAGTWRLAVWERGVGPTQACGSAACATAATLWWADATADADVPSPPLTIHLPGGTLRLEGGPEAVLMVGDARVVFSGTVRVPAEARAQG